MTTLNYACPACDTPVTISGKALITDDLIGCPSCWTRFSIQSQDYVAALRMMEQIWAVRELERAAA